MHHQSLKQFLAQGRDALAKGPIALILVEDEAAVEATLRHHLGLGFKAVVAFMPPELELADDLSGVLHRVDHDVVREGGAQAVVNAVIAAAPGQWLYYCYNGEFLFFPFCESRTIGEMLAFHGEERRDAVLGYVIDIYARDLEAHPDAVSLEQAYLDKSGYYALARHSPEDPGMPLERQLDFFGGLRWRFEEHVPEARRRIDRIPLFRAARGLTLHPDHRFSDEEYNTYSCPWHHNITVSIASFRTAKALKLNAGSSFDINTFYWHNSVKFEWNSQQFLDLGLMEPGQWF